MLIRRTNSGVEIETPSKVNLFLEVLGRRPDGYHDLDTIMMATSLTDTLRFVPRRDDQILLHLVDRAAWNNSFVGFSGASGESTLVANRQSMPLDSRNLIWRALDAVRQIDGHRFGMDVWIDKRIPSQAGMGGGSSDAAAAIVAGMALWRRSYDSDLAGTIAARLGSDVNFFLEGNLGRAWAAACQSRGERVRPISITHPMHLVIAQPPEGCSTADVFRALVLPEKKSSIESVFDVLRDGNLSQLSSVLFNRLEQAAETQSHWIGKYRLAFSKVKAMAHVMTGSGSARFGICASASHAVSVARVLSSLLPGAVYAARSWNAPAIEQQLSALGYLSKSTAKPMDLGRSGCGNH